MTNYNINPQKIKEKIEGYINELKTLKSLDYEMGNDKMYDIDANVKTFLNVAFDNSKERWKDYQGIAMAVSGLGHATYQKWYIGDIDHRIRTLNSWVEEMKLVLETEKGSQKLDNIKEQIEEKNKSSPKFDELREQIEEKGLEATRREKVAETKFYGAVIELLDFQRNMLKDKEANTKSLITLQKDVQEIKESLATITKGLLENKKDGAQDDKN